MYALSFTHNHGHSWRVRLAKQETLTPPGHLVSPLVCRGPWMSTVVLYCWCHSGSASVLLYFTCISDIFFLKSMYYSSCKIPEKPGICISYSSKRSSALYWLHNDSLYAKHNRSTEGCSKLKRSVDMTSFLQKVFLQRNICLYDNSHICCLWPEKDPIWFWGTKENIKLAAWTLHCFSAMKLNHSLL